jgi:2-polyprenyl-6-hydroxyphenyl methylase/3-demethylubiquinone-9 3-methyltransferase
MSYFAEYKKKRGMSLRHDWIDWLGGYPFEVAKPEKIFDFFHDRGFALERLVTTTRLGCNEFVFRRPGSAIIDVSTARLPARHPDFYGAGLS